MALDVTLHPKKVFLPEWSNASKRKRNDEDKDKYGQGALYAGIQARGGALMATQFPPPLATSNSPTLRWPSVGSNRGL